jgi:hypothetical protein
MRRLFWLAMGITIGALIVRRLTKVAEKLTPKGMAGSVGSAIADLAHEARGFVVDVRAATSRREDELRTGAGLDASTNAVNGVHRK